MPQKILDVSQRAAGLHRIASGLRPKVAASGVRAVAFPAKAAAIEIAKPLSHDRKALQGRLRGVAHGRDEGVFTQHAADVGTKGRRCNAQCQGPLGIENFVNALIGDSVAAIRVGCKPALISGKFQRLWRNADDFNQGVGHI